MNGAAELVGFVIAAAWTFGWLAAFVALTLWQARGKFSDAFWLIIAAGLFVVMCVAARFGRASAWFETR